MALVVDRFELHPDGTYRGFEDFCVLNARRTDEKYRGSYETSVMKRFQQFANLPAVVADVEKLLTLIVLNCALRNGDAHLRISASSTTMCLVKLVWHRSMIL